MKHEEFLGKVRDLTEVNTFTVLDKRDLIKLLAIIKKLKEQRDIVLRAAEVDELGYGSADDYDKELDEIVGMG